MSSSVSAFVVDDEAMVRKTLGHLLERQGYQVSTFASAEAFCEHAPEVGPHLLVVDKNLPGMSGLELIEQRQQAGHVFEAILMTGSADLDSAVEAVRLGIFRYVRKPFTFDELIADVRGAVERLMERQKVDSSEPDVLAQVRAPLSAAEAHLHVVSRALDEAHIAPDARLSLDIARQRLAAADQLLGNGKAEPSVAEADDISVVMDEVDLEKCLRRAADDVADVAKQRKRPLWFELDDDKQLTVISDQAVLSQLLRSLIALAVDDGAGDEPVVIDVAERDDVVSVHIVSQSGTGRYSRPECHDTLQFCQRLTRLLHGELTIGPYLKLGVNYALSLPSSEFGDAPTARSIKMSDIKSGPRDPSL